VKATNLNSKPYGLPKPSSQDSQNNVILLQDSKGKTIPAANRDQQIRKKFWYSSQNNRCRLTWSYCNNGILNIVNTCQQILWQ